MCRFMCLFCPPYYHYCDVIMDTMASQITSITIVYSAVYSDASKPRVTGVVRGIPRGPGNSPHKWPVVRKMFQFDDVIMMGRYASFERSYINSNEIARGYSIIFTKLLKWCFLLLTLTLISTWMNNYIHYKTWYEITYPFPNLIIMDRLFHPTLYWGWDYLIRDSKRDPRCNNASVWCVRSHSPT